MAGPNSLPRMPSAAGVDVGGTKCLGVVLDEDGAVAREHRIATPAGTAALMDAIVEVVEKLRASGPVDSLGVGVPGLVDREGVLHFAPNLPGVVGVPVRQTLEDRLGLPVRVDNDATCAAWGEQQLGAGRGVEHVVLVTLGTGIGGGFVSDGRLWRGARGFAGEIGHMVVDPNGPRCVCGRRGCWETLASGRALARLAREAVEAGRAGAVLSLAGGDASAVLGEHVATAAAAGDDDAIAILSQVAWWIALGLANLVNAFDPELIVIGGGLVEMGDLLLDPVRTAFVQIVEATEHRPLVPVVGAALGEHAGAIGAACLHREEAN